VDLGERTVQVERKHWTEIMPNIDKVERQLDNERTLADETYLLVEDVPIPTVHGMATYEARWEPSPSKGSPRAMFRKMWETGSKGRPQPQLYTRIMSWFWKLDKMGITVVQTPNLIGSAQTLATMWKNSQVEEFATFKRYIKAQVKAESRDPQVLTLMGVAGGQVGEKLATLMIDAYGTAYQAMSAAYDDLAVVIGPGRAATFLNALGRSNKHG
jgi:hypothetical protein